MGHSFISAGSYGWQRLLHTEGVICNSRGQRPRFTSTNKSDPERVAQNMRLCDPFQGRGPFLKRDPGGVAPAITSELSAA